MHYFSLQLSAYSKVANAVSFEWSTCTFLVKSAIFKSNLQLAPVSPNAKCISCHAISSSQIKFLKYIRFNACNVHIFSYNHQLQNQILDIHTLFLIYTLCTFSRTTFSSQKKSLIFKLLCFSGHILLTPTAQLLLTNFWNFNLSIFFFFCNVQSTLTA